MDPALAVSRNGGLATHQQLLQVSSRKAIGKAVQRGDLCVARRGVYGLPGLDRARSSAAALAGAASHASAALLYGWEVATPPERPQVIVPRNRKVSAHRAAGVKVRWRDLDERELARGITSAIRTVLDCSIELAYPEALAVADSALRHGLDHDELTHAALRLRRGRAAALRVVNDATGLAANPFESTLRALAQVPGITVEPQVEIREGGFFARPDLVDRRRRLILEADSWAFHAGRSAFDRDCERYNALVVRGWTVLRFSWEQVMLRPQEVGLTLERWLALPDGAQRRAL